MFAFKLSDDSQKYTVFDVSMGLRRWGWLLPAYAFPKDCDDVSVLRIVVRNGFGQDMADMFLAHMERALGYLSQLSTPLPKLPGEKEFAH